MSEVEEVKRHLLELMGEILWQFRPDLDARAEAIAAIFAKKDVIPSNEVLARPFSVENEVREIVGVLAIYFSDKEMDHDRIAHVIVAKIMKTFQNHISRHIGEFATTDVIERQHEQILAVLKDSSFFTPGPEFCEIDCDAQARAINKLFFGDFEKVPDHMVRDAVDSES